VNPAEPLGRAGWLQWEDFPSEEMHREIYDETHLRVEVWDKEP